MWCVSYPIVFAWLAMLPRMVDANECSITPIYVDFHDRFVNVNGLRSIQYGLFIGVGTPSQNQSLWPALSHNETTFAGVDFCQDSSATDCNNESHGSYSPAASQSFNRTTDYHTLDAISLSNGETLETGTDTLNIFTHYFDPSPPNVTKINNFPVDIISNHISTISPWFGPAGLLGLGPSSTILQRLYDNHLISSRSFGLYVGTGYSPAHGAINGSLTLGGYDSGRFTGPVHTYPLATAPSDASSFKVQVESITYFDGNGGSSVLNGSNFDAYLTTSQFALSFPQRVTQNFKDLTGAFDDSDTEENPLDMPGDFHGTLTIKLSSGLIVNYTTSELANVSNISPISAKPLSAPVAGSPLFGTAFLAKVYLMASYDSTQSEFHLATALPDAPYIQIRALCANQVPQAATQPKISKFAKNGMTGAIVGGVLGGVGLTFAVWWGLRKYMQHRYRKAENDSNDFVERGANSIDEQRNPITAYYARTRSHRASYINARGGSNSVSQEALGKDKEDWTDDSMKDVDLNGPQCGPLPLQSLATESTLQKQSLPPQDGTRSIQFYQQSQNAQVQPQQNHAVPKTPYPGPGSVRLPAGITRQPTLPISPTSIYSQATIPESQYASLPAHLVQHLQRYREQMPVSALTESTYTTSHYPPPLSTRRKPSPPISPPTYHTRPHSYNTNIPAAHNTKWPLLPRSTSVSSMSCYEDEDVSHLQELEDSQYGGLSKPRNLTPPPLRPKSAEQKKQDRRSSSQTRNHELGLTVDTHLGGVSYIPPARPWRG